MKPCCQAGDGCCENPAKPRVKTDDTHETTADTETPDPARAKDHLLDE